MTSFLFLLIVDEQNFLATLTAASIDSAPELQKNTLSAKEFLHNFFAKVTEGSFMYRFDKCQSSSDCFLRIFIRSLFE